MAETHIKTAQRFLEGAGRVFELGDYHLTVRWSQECIELSVKAVLRIYGIEFPKTRDVSTTLTSLELPFPQWFKERLERIASTMKAITPKRGPALYGDEEKMIPPSELFGKEETEDFLKGAEFVFNSCQRLIREWSGLAL